MKLKKLIYILLVIVLVPCFATAEEYPFLPTMLKEKLISVFGINTAGKTMLYEKVNIYDDFDAWMIGWFDNQTKIIAGITDTEDIIYYSNSRFDGTSGPVSGNSISSGEGEEAAYDFLTAIMPTAELKLISSNAYEYTFTDSYSSIPILGRVATVVVDKFSGEVIYYKGFGQTDCSFIRLADRLVTPEHAFEIFYENIGLEMVYNTVFDDSARTKAVRPMYILNRSNLTAVDARTGKVNDIVMQDYNYYYNDDFFDPRYYYDNNIHTEEKIFTADGSVSASRYSISDFLNTPGLNLSEGYCGKVVPGRLNYFSDGDGSENFREVFRLDIVPTSHAIDIYKFCDKFDSGNSEWFNNVICDTPFVFVRAYVDAKTGQLLDFKSVKNISYSPDTGSTFSLSEINDFVSDATAEEIVKYYGMQQSGNLCHITYARYVNGARVIGEGVSVIYDTALGSITDYTLSVSDTEFLPVSFMKTPEQMKESVKKELSLGLVYVDKTKTSKYLVYDVTDIQIAFDPVTGDRIDRLNDTQLPVIAIYSVNDATYTLSGVPFSAPSPVISSDRLFIPIKFISDALGYELTQEGSSATLSNGTDTVSLTVGNRTCTINGEALTLDLSPISLSENIYISAQSLRSLFGMFVSWDSDTNKIHLIK